MAQEQKYRLVKADSAQGQGRSTTSQYENASTQRSSNNSGVQRKARFWKGLSVFLVVAAIVVAALFWMHSVSGSLSSIRHSLAQQASSNARQQGQLAQIQSSINSVQHQIAALGNQMRIYFVHLWSAIVHSK